MVINMRDLMCEVTIHSLNTQYLQGKNAQPRLTYLDVVPSPDINKHCAGVLEFPRDIER